MDITVSCEFIPTCGPYTCCLLPISNEYEFKTKLVRDRSFCDIRGRAFASVTQTTRNTIKTDSIDVNLNPRKFVILSFIHFSLSQNCSNLLIYEDCIEMHKYRKHKDVEPLRTMNVISHRFIRLILLAHANMMSYFRIKYIILSLEFLLK